MSALALLRSARRRLLLVWLIGGTPIAIALGLLASCVAGFDTGSMLLTLALLAADCVVNLRSSLDAKSFSPSPSEELRVLLRRARGTLGFT